MPTHVKKIRAALVAACLPWTSLFAAPPQPAPGSAGAPAATPTPPATTPPATAPAAAPTDAETISSDIFNTKPEEGTVGKEAANLLGIAGDKLSAADILSTPALDNAATGARFKTYLSLPEVPDQRIKDYFDKMGAVSDALKGGSTFPAWKILYSMADYTDLDAGISADLANRIEAIWNSDRTKNGLELANNKLKNNIEDYTRNADMEAEDMHQQDLKEESKVGNKGSGNNNNSGNSSATNSALLNPMADPVAAEAAMMPTMSGSLQRKMELTGEYLKLLEARANVKLNEIRENKMDSQDKEDFTAYIRTLFANHRYYHVILAADFYRALFNEGEYPTEIQNDVNFSLETNQRVTQSVEVFKYKAQKGEVAAAATELQTGFLDNEYHPALQSLPRTEKETVGDYLAKLDVLKNQIEVRDFEQVEPQLDAIKKIASDFDTTKPLALVNDIKLSSRLQLGKAKLLAQQGQLTDAMKVFQTAAEEWPGNPDLKNSANNFFGTEDVQNQSTADFDRLVSEQNYREIFDKQLMFAPAVHGDPAREQQLKDALTKVQHAEEASEKANLMVMNGDVDGAWETIEQATKDWPDDVKLNKQLASLSARSADFVSAINKARDAEAKKEYGYSLSWYVNAQSFYPASTIALAGIDNVSKQILSSHNALQD